MIVGEVLPYQTADSNFYMTNGGTAGVTVPLNWRTDYVDSGTGLCDDGGPSEAPLEVPLQLRQQGLQERAPGRGQLLDG